MFFFSLIFKRQRREFVKNLFAGRMFLTSIQFTNPVELGKYFCYDPSIHNGLFHSAIVVSREDPFLGLTLTKDVIFTFM